MPKLFYIFVFMVIGVIVYSLGYIGKHASYYLFYEDLVQQTIVEMVKEDALR